MLEKVMTRLKSIPEGDSFLSTINVMLEVLRPLLKTKTIDIFFQQKKTDELFCWYRQTQGTRHKESYLYALNSFKREDYYNAENVFAYPLKARGEKIGAIVCYMKSAQVESIELVTMLIDYFALLLLSAKISIRANKDKLTGLSNRGAIYKKLSEWENADKNIGIILMDIDKFKHYNDTYGHPIGDHVLKVLAKTLKENIKGTLIGRFGGEEFLLAVADADDGLIESMMEKVRKLIKNTDFSTSEFMLRVTSSFGGSVRSTNNAVNVNALIGQADEALYESKRNGRNRCTLYNAS